MTVDTDTPIETGRTWQDLPPEPPVGDPLDPAIPPVEPPAVVEETAAPFPWRTAAVVLLVLLALLLLWLLWPAAEQSTPDTTIPDTGSTPNTTQAPSPIRPPSAPSDEPVADVAAALLPSVVQIDTPYGTGSGFVYDGAGLILTAAHVVAGSQEVEVRFSDGSAATGTVVARDMDEDVAVVAVTADDLVPAPLGDGQNVRVGETAIAVGNPFGLGQSVTVGVISALDRILDVGGHTINGLIQTDAAINVGNSGGPLADGSGSVIGINIAIASASGGSNGVGFAVPIEIALGVAAGITPQSPPAPVDDPLSPLGLDPLGDAFGDLFGPDFAPDDLNGLLDLFGGIFTLPPEIQQFLDQLQRLGQDLDDLGGGANPFGPFSFNNPQGELFTLGTLPAGYTLAGEQTTTSGNVTTKVATVIGSDGTVTIRATAGGDAARALTAADGDVITVRGQLGKLEVTGSRISLVWVEANILFEAIAPGAAGSETVLAIVNDLEVPR
jgi:putative serine protease PepD